MPLHMNNSHLQDIYNFRQTYVSDFLGWLARILHLSHSTLTNASAYYRSLVISVDTTFCTLYYSGPVLQ